MFAETHVVDWCDSYCADSANQKTRVWKPDSSSVQRAAGSGDVREPGLILGKVVRAICVGVQRGHRAIEPCLSAKLIGMVVLHPTQARIGSWLLIKQRVTVTAGPNVFHTTQWRTQASKEGEQTRRGGTL